RDRFGAATDRRPIALIAAVALAIGLRAVRDRFRSVPGSNRSRPTTRTTPGSRSAIGAIGSLQASSSATAERSGAESSSTISRSGALLAAARLRVSGPEVNRRRGLGGRRLRPRLPVVSPCGPPPRELGDGHIIAGLDSDPLPVALHVPGLLLAGARPQPDAE